MIRQDLTSNCAGLKWAGYLSTTSVYGDHQVCDPDAPHQTRLDASRLFAYASYARNC